MNIVGGIVAIAFIGLIIPNAYGEVFVNNEPYLFSIEYPSDWSPIRPIDFLENGITFDQDGSGVNGFWVSIWKGAIEDEMADYKITYEDGTTGNIVATEEMARIVAGGGSYELIPVPQESEEIKAETARFEARLWRDGELNRTDKFVTVTDHPEHDASSTSSMNSNSCSSES